MEPNQVPFFCSGMTRANGFPRLRIRTVSPFESHFEIRLKSFRNSRTVAVFIVIHMYHKHTGESIQPFCGEAH